MKTKETMPADSKEEFDWAFEALEKRIRGLNKDTKKSLGSIVQEVHGIAGVLEKQVLDKAKTAKNAEKLEDAVDAYFKKKGFLLDDSYISNLQVPEKFLKNTKAFVADLGSKMENLAKETGLSPLYLAEKVHIAFDDIEDYFLVAAKL